MTHFINRDAERIKNSLNNYEEKRDEIILKSIPFSCIESFSTFKDSYGQSCEGIEMRKKEMEAKGIRLICKEVRMRTFQDSHGYMGMIEAVFTKIEFINKNEKKSS